MDVHPTKNVSIGIDPIHTHIHKASMFQCQATKDIVARPQLGRLLLPAAHGADSACAVSTRVARVARVPQKSVLWSPLGPGSWEMLGDLVMLLF